MANSMFNAPADRCDNFAFRAHDRTHEAELDPL